MKTVSRRSTPKSKANAPAPVPTGLGGGKKTRARISQDEPGSLFGGLQLISPPDHESRWRDLTLDSTTFDRIAPVDLLELLCDLSPDISRALWDFLRLCNPGWEVKALRPGSEEVDEAAQAALDGFLALLTDYYGAVDVVFNRLFFAAWLRGGFFAELVLDQRGRLPVDLATPDPRWIQFRRRPDPVRGVVWELWQWQGGKQVSLDRPTLRYVPIDPFPGKPYGRPLASPALFPAVFLLALLHDLRRVVQQQGYPRIDIAVVMERLLAAMPPDIAGQPDEVRRWLQGAIDDVNTAYAALEPDDAYTHPDWIQVNKPVGTVDTSSLGAVDGLIKGLERMLVRALKTMPLMMGTTDGVSEANANRQYEAQVQGIKALQHLGENLLQWLFGTALRVQGKQATVEVRFAENRAAEMLRDAQVEKLQIENAAAAYAAGWISQDEAAQKGAGKDKADVPEPRGPILGSAAPNPATSQPDPGSNRELADGAILLREAVGLNGHAHA